MATVLFNKIKLGGANAISISYSSSEIKYVKHGDGTLYYDTQSSTIYDTPSISLSYGSLATAKGGTLSPSLSYSQKWRKVGYSGNTYEQTAYTSGATVSYSISGAGATIDSSTGVVTWASLGTTISDGRTAEVTVTVTKNGKSNKAKYTVRLGANSKTVKSTSGGVVTYGAVTAGTIKNVTVSAAGGSGTATAGNGSQPWSKTAVITTYEYTSGSTSLEQTEDATRGTDTISPSVASISATGSNLGTTEKAAATLKLQAVKWSGGGNKSASGTMYVYQEANAITNTTWTYDGVTVTNHGYADDIPASGGTVYGYGGTGSQKKTPTYTWTSTKTSNGTSVACSVTCGKYSGVYTGNLRTTETDRTYIGDSTATLTGEGGKTAKCSVRVYQEANIVESSEQYDGPYYRGGVTTYGSITAGSITPTSVSDIPASGGSITFTAGNGSQSYSTTKKEVRYRYRDKYTSGSYGSIYYGSWSTHTPASSGSESVTPYEKTKTISGSNLGTTEKDRTSLGYKTFTWKANGKSTSKNTTTVYQEANKITNTKYTYSNLCCTLTNNFTASGGSAKMGVFVDKTPTYTWTSTKTSTGSTFGTNVTSDATKTINQQYFHSNDAATSGTAIDRFSISGATIEHSSMYAFVGYDYVSFKATYEGLTATSEVCNVRNSYHYIYNWKTLSINYPTTNSDGISALKPLVSGTQTYTINYTSGHSGIQNTANITTVSFDSLTVSGTGCSVYDAQTGAIKWTSNTSTSSRSATISGLVTANGVSKSFSTTAILEGKEEDFYNYSIIIQEENGSPDINIAIDSEEDFDLNNNHNYSGIVEDLSNYVLYEGYSSKSTPSLGFTISYPGSWKPNYFTVEVMGDGQITTGLATVYPSYGQEYHYVVKCTGASLNGTGIIDVNIKEY